MNILTFQMYTRCLVSLLLLGSTLSDKSVISNEQNKDSYEDGVGSSYSVPLNPPNSAKVSKNSRKYSVSGDDLDRADLHVAASYKSPVLGRYINGNLWN